MANPGFFRIEYNLDYPFPITQVNEGKTSMVTTAVNPTSQSYHGTNMLLVQLTTTMGSKQEGTPDKESLSLS
jgi:hypothetical protein